MTLLLVGLALLVAWPLYNVALVFYTASDSVGAALHRRREAKPPTGHEPQVFWIVVPCLNEERVVGQTIRNALALKGPTGSRTRVLVVDDGSDDGTPAVIAAVEDPNLHVLRRTLPNARKGKGEALNAAFQYIRQQSADNGDDPDLVVVGVIDGDGRGSDNMLVEVSRALGNTEVGAVQCRVRIHNRDRILAAVQDMEFGCIANASQLMRNSLGTVGLGGNGQFVRLSALNLLGDAPWSSCLVEDLELGLRLHLVGVRIRYTSRAAVTQQGLVNVRRLLRQRTRWAQGNLQCIRYVPKVYKAAHISNAAMIEMLYYLLAPWFNAVGTVLMAAVAGYSLWRMGSDGPTSELVATVAVWLAAMVAPFLTWGALHRLQLRDEKLGRCLLAGLCYPAFLLLGLLSTYRAIGRQLARRNAWAKTERLAEAGTPGHSPSKQHNGQRRHGRRSLRLHGGSTQKDRGTQMSSLPEVHLIAGTRPEAIKLAPVVVAMRAAGRVTPVLVASGQHPTMVAQALQAFDLEPDVTLRIERVTGSQPELMTEMINQLDALFAERQPAAVVVQGDTTTTLAGAMAAFWRHIPVVHLEAGLRSGDLESPFPEEANRRLVSQLARLHLAPTALAATNLLDESVPAAQVFIAGNTVVDATLAVAARRLPFDDLRLEQAVAGGNRLVLVTAHRRESWGEPLDRVLGAVRKLVRRYPDIQVVMPSHPNPAVRAQVDAGLAGVERVIVTDPLPYPALSRLLSHAYLVLTDSGGIQEEAPSFGVPALVLREVTERVESLHAGCAKLVGTDQDLILTEASRLLDDKALRDSMTASGNPYGDGLASVRTEEAVAALLGLVAGLPEPMPPLEVAANALAAGVGA